MHISPFPRLRLGILALSMGVSGCRHGGDKGNDPRPQPDPELQLVKAKCVSCHPLPEAHTLPAGEFPDWQASHRKRVPLDQTDLDRIRRYLLPDGTP